MCEDAHPTHFSEEHEGERATRSSFKWILITTLVGVDDSFGRCAAICVERKGARDVLGVQALSAFSRSLGQPRLVIQSDGEPAILELVQKT